MSRVSQAKSKIFGRLGIFALCVGIASATLLPTTTPAQAYELPAVPPQVIQMPVISERAKTAKLPSKVKTTSNLNLRKSANTTSKPLYVIPRGTILIPLQRASNGWYKVKHKKFTGWVSNQYVSPLTTSNTPAKPAAKPFTQKFDQYRGPNKTKRVMLTYDDCPLNLKSYEDVLNYAAAKNIGLVIAPTGNCLKKYQKKHGVDLAALARAKGQWVISHTATHKDMRTLSCAQGAKELLDGGIKTNVGRPPYGALNENARCAFRKAKMSIWTWTRSTRDWDTKSKKTTIARAAAAGPGETVLMHMHWDGFSPDSIKQIRDKLAKKNVQLCRAYRGTDARGPIEKTPQNLPSSLAC